jgi:hypothetical protein
MAKDQIIPRDKYFATLEDPNELASAIAVKITEWRRWCESRGLLSLWEAKLSNYYGSSRTGNNSQGITPGGSEGELSLIKVNDMRQLLQEQLVLVTSQRPAGEAKAVNTDSDAIKSARIGTALAEYYLQNVGLEAKFVQSVETALVCDEAFVDLFWDKEGGDPIAVDLETLKPEMSGDVTMRVHCPWNVARDPGATVDQQKWHILSYKANRFDLAAAFPKFAEEIINTERDDLPEVNMNKLPDGSDMIYVHLLVHDRTAAVPNGRYSLMVANRVVLDSKLPYKDYPVDRISPSDVIDGTTGYSASNDLLGLEQITDALHSIATSNNVTFGGQSLVGPQGAGLNITDLGKGLRYFELPADQVDKLQPLQMTRTAPETYGYIDKLESKKQQQTGSTSGVLAQQASQGASGSSMALVDSKAIQYNSGIQRSYFRLLSRCMTKLVGILRAYADTPRVARIVGKMQAQGLKEFKYTGEDLSAISTIVYEMVNPISQTQGGRLQMAQDLIAGGLVKSPKQYISVVTTGNLHTLTQDDEADQALILEENELLSEGKAVQAVITENHPDHIKSHMSVLSSPKKKQDPTLVQATLAHIQEHIALWTDASIQMPGLLAALGVPPIPMPAPMGAPMPGQAGPGAPQGDPGEMVGGGEPPAQAAADEVKQPNLPFNPATGERAEVPGVTQ